jgi:branched-chain amino acid transport system ATP-binding protein
VTPGLMRILEVVALTKRFAGFTALDAVSFTVEEGQILGLFGPPGAGKTTCLHCLAGLAAPDGGRVIFDGRDITSHQPHEVARAGIGRTFQVVKPFRDLTAAENVMLALGRPRGRGPAALLGGWRGRGPRRQALDLLDQVGLSDEADRTAGLLPPGMQKRLEMARALALRPRLILLDEPLHGLSHAERELFASLVARLRAQGITGILAQRRMQDAVALVDRVAVLDHGAVIASGPPERVQSDPKVIQAYRGEDAR